MMDLKIRGNPTFTKYVIKGLLDSIVESGNGKALALTIAIAMQVITNIEAMGFKL